WLALARLVLFVVPTSCPPRRSSVLLFLEVAGVLRQLDDGVCQPLVRNADEALRATLDAIRIAVYLDESVGEVHGFIEVYRDANGDRKSTRLNSSHGSISSAVFCWQK